MALPIEVRATAAQALGMLPARFLRHYWQKRPLLIRGAFADFDNPVAPDDLAGLACEELALARIVVWTSKRSQGKKGYSGLPRRKDEANAGCWDVRGGPFVESDFASLPKTHWTLLVQDVDKWDADVAALLDRFSFLPSWRIDDVMVSYAEDGGSVGAHVDQYDVFLLQGLGRRRWQISTDASAPIAFRDDVELKLLRRFTPTQDWVLEPGDMLYLPPGVPHHGVAIGECMTYSIGMRAPSQAELLIDFAETFAEAMPENLRLTDADLAPSRHVGEIDNAALTRVMRAMPWLRWPMGAEDSATAAGSRVRGGNSKNKRLRLAKVAPERAQIPADSSMLRAWFGCFITRYRSAQMVAPPPRALSDAAFARARAQDASVQRNPWSRVAWMRAPQGATLFVAGDQHACTLRLARLVCTRVNFPLAAAGHGRRDQAVLRALVDAGHLAIVALQRQRRAR